VVAAVDRYQDIPVTVRETLKKRMTERKYDEIATIKRDSIAGAYRYTELRDMHFGAGQICRTVTRDRWQAQTQERGLVYCEEGHCIIVPTVCRNVSRVTRVPMQNAQADEPMGPMMEPLAPPMALAGVPEGNNELQFEAPAAGATPSFLSGLSGSSPVLPGGSDAGLAGGGTDMSDPLSAPSWSSSAGLPLAGVLPPALGGGTAPGGIDPGVPGTGGGVVPIATPVPEPSTYAMMALGFGLVAWAARRRRQAKRD
jgi:PEP-CTERM motif